MYITTAYPGVVKGWHDQNYQDDNFVVVKGMIKLVSYDRRDESPAYGEINEFVIGDQKPMLVHIPVGVAHSFKGIGTDEAVFVNTVTEPYNYETPDEYRIAPHGPEIDYDWELKDG